MTIVRKTFSLSGLALLASFALTATSSAAELKSQPGTPAASDPVTVSSSSSAMPDAPHATVATDAAGGAPKADMAPSFRPFSAVAIGAKFGVDGIGFDIATPLNKHLNLRGGGTFFGYSPNITTDGLQITGSLSFKTVGASLDYYPRGGSFRISPGLTVYNGNKLTANVVVPGNSSFTLNDTTYYSNTTNPITGTFNVGFGNKVAPSLTMGWGNMIPRKTGQHWSVPFEIGFEYINNPTIALSLSGSACSAQNNVNCQSVTTTPSIETNVQQEQSTLQNDISPLKVFPILSIGLSYKFGK